MAEIEFTVHLLGDLNGRVVCILGNVRELGTWDVAKALPMKLVKIHENESVWHIASTFDVMSHPLEYKYVVKHPKTHELVSWEGLPGNRTFTIAQGRNVALRAPSCQSSTYVTSRAPVPGPRGADLGNNGNTNGFQEWRCCRTKKEANPWWEVDLKKNYRLSSIHLWNAMTYHEQARHPSGRPPKTSKSSTSSPAPPLWMFISKEPLGRGADSFQDAQAKAAADASSVCAIEVDNSFDSRVRSQKFTVKGLHGSDSSNGVDCPHSITSELPPVEGRYVRLQCAGSSCALQFAELEVFTQDAVNDREIVEQDISCIKRDDGFYGVSTALDADLREYIESGWLDPAVDVAELKVWIGSFDPAKPAIQWLGGEIEHSRVAIEMRHEKKQTTRGCQGGHSSQHHQNSGLIGTWEPLPVESKSAALLDNESTELCELLRAQQQKNAIDLSAYLNNDPYATHSTTSLAGLSWLSRIAFVQSLKKSDVEALSGQVATRNYKKGESILQYAEQKHTIFYIKLGNVELFGPGTSTGSNLLGTLDKDSIFNEMGIFGGWSKQPALYKAKDKVVAEVLEFDTLLTVLGTSKVASIRNDYTRSRHRATPSFETNEVHYMDSIHAQVFSAKVPVSVVNGSGKYSNGIIHRWIFDIYDCQLDAQSGIYIKTKLLGSAYLLPSQIDKHGEMDQTIPIFSTKMDIVGELTLTYLALTPFVHAKNNIANVWRSYWRERPPLTIGHRGMGRSHYQVDGHRLALTRENTLASFILAGRSGADFVEFDVQLTKDRVPVVYHDFMVNVGFEDKSAGSFGTKPEMYEIGIHDISFRQLTQSYTTPVPHKSRKSQVLQKRVKKHWVRLQGDKQLPSPRHRPLRHDETVAAAEEDHLVEFFPRLEDLLVHVPAEVGLNIEIKYPDKVFHPELCSLHSFAINAYIDRVLQCVFDYAGSRRIFFSCFSPSACVALRAKQTKYPVLLLSCGSMASNAIDARMTLQFAINFATMENLQGVVSNSSALIETPELIPLVKKCLGTVFITWGDHNTNHEMVQLQKRYAIDGVISDNVIDLINQDKKLQYVGDN